MERSRSIQRVLVGCSGDAGLQIVRAIEAAGMEAVAVYTDGESRAPHLQEAAYAVHLGGPTPTTDPQAILSAALDAGADAVMMGPAPLARSPELAQYVQQCGMAWIGARIDHLAALATIPGARARARDAGLEVVPGDGPNERAEEAIAAIARLGPPLRVRSVHRGGPARRFEDVEAAQSALGSAPWPNVVERAPTHARRITFLVLGDGAGNAIHLGAHEATAPDGAGGVLRECPPPGLGPEWVNRVGAMAAEACAAMGWLGVAGVVFAVEGGQAWCVDIDPMLPAGFALHDQVYGMDLVTAQLTLAAGEALGWAQEGVAPRGAAAEACLTATGPGILTSLRGLPRTIATALHARLDRIDPLVAPTLAVLRVRAPTRHASLVRLRACLDRLSVVGPATNIEALRALFDRREFWDGAVSVEAEW